MGFMNAASGIAGLSSKYAGNIWNSAKGIAGSAWDKMKDAAGFIDRHGEGIGNVLGAAGRYIAPGAFPVAAKAIDALTNVLPENKITSTLKRISHGTTFKNLHDAPVNSYKSSASRTVPGEGLPYGQATAPRQMNYRSDSLYDSRKQMENSQPQNRSVSAYPARRKIRVKRRVRKDRTKRGKKAKRT